MSRYPEEPHVVIGGVLVHVAAVEMLEQLRATGHRVALTDDGVVVEPADLFEEQAYLFEALAEDLELLLLVGGLTVH